MLSKKVVNSLLVLFEDYLCVYPEENFLSVTINARNQGNSVGGFAVVFVFFFFLF